MGWQLLDKPKTQRVTKKLAEEFATMEPAPHDRPLSERRLQVYQRMLEKGEFRPVTWASALCKETGDVYRVNGKHTSTMLAGLEKTPEFYVTIEEYECETLEDVAKLYATFDSSMQSRTAKDIYLSFAATVPALAAVPSNFIISSIAGIAIHKLGLQNNATAAERAELILDHDNFPVWLAQRIETAQTTWKETGVKGKQKCAHVLRSPVIAAMFGSFEKSRKDATEFWDLVLNETGKSPGTPDRKLARYLVSISMARVGNDKSKKIASTREVYVKCLHAWNAWRRGETTNLNYYSEAKIPTLQ